MNKNFTKTIEENFGLVATFVGFVIDTITLIALINSKVAPTIPFIEYKLDATFQLVLWLVAFITYLGFLRERWLRISRKLSTRPEDTFSRFIIYDLIVRFKYPFFLLPFIFFLGLLFPVLGQLSFNGWFLLIILSITSIVFIIIATESEKAKKRSEEEWSRLDNEQIYNLWLARIEKQIKEKGYATNIELSHLYTERISYCNKSLWRYHSDFELEKDLICVSESIEKGYGDSKQTLSLWVVAPRDLIKHRPWLINYLRYFDL